MLEGEGVEDLLVAEALLLHLQRVRAGEGMVRRFCMWPMRISFTCALSRFGRWDWGVMLRGILNA